jgi:peptide/nickel transport system substrate-binding protein
MKRYLRYVAAIGVLAIAAAACGGGGTGDTTGPTDTGEGAVRGGTLKGALSSDVFATFDPQKEYYSVSWAFLRCCLTRTLMSYNGKPTEEGGTELLPDLAAGEPEVSEDGLTWTFTLKDGIKFGPPLSREIIAQDFVTAIERTATPEGSSGGYSFYYSPIEGFDDAYGSDKIDEVSGVEAVDEKTLRITVTEPTGDLGFRLAMPAASPVPAEAAEGHLKDYGQFIVSSGPYMYEGMENVDFSLPPKQQEPPSGVDVGKSYIFVRNPDWDQATDDLRFAYVDRIEVPVGGEVQDLLDRVEQGDLDVCIDCGATPEVIAKYSQDPVLQQRMHVYFNDAISYSSMNVGVPPFDDVHVRKAVNYVTDKAALIRIIGGELNGVPAGHAFVDGLLNNLLIDYDPYGTPDHRGNLEAAMEEIKQSAYDSDGDGICDAPECKDVLTVAASEDPAPKTVEAIQKSFEQIGITLDVKFLNTSPMYAKCNDPAERIAFCPTVGWGKDYPDAYTFGPPLFGREGLGPNGCCNYAILGATPEELDKWGYSVSEVPSIDAEMAACQALPAGDERISCWADVDRKLMEEIVPWIPRRFANNIDIVSERVHYTYDQFSGQVSLDHVWLTGGGA